LSSDLLTGIENQSQGHTLAERLVLPESRVIAGDGFLLVLNGLANLQQLFLDFLLGITNSLQGFTSSLNIVASLNIPGDNQYFQN
jgi:hypothetical protein